MQYVAFLLMAIGTLPLLCGAMTVFLARTDIERSFSTTAFKSGLFLEACGSICGLLHLLAI